MQDKTNNIQKSEISRRNFLKILGTTSAAGLAGCAEDATQNIYPFVKGEVEQIPGVAVWYKSTCSECSAGCGIQVRTREGRAVKIEGNGAHPVNGGGLCALGQSSLQELYDPDRVRQPLKRSKGVGDSAEFVPVSWEEALSAIAASVKEAKGNKGIAFISGEHTGALSELTAEWSKKLGAENVVYDPTQPIGLAEASEAVFGDYGIPQYAFEEAEVVVNFGADFLETWVSPTGFARGWAKSRRSAAPVRVIHIEPRLSLTGANADLWLQAKPGSEIHLAKAILKIVLEAGRGGNLAPDVRAGLVEMVSSVNIDAAASEAGISAEKLLLAARYLVDAKKSLVLSGGASTASLDPLPLHIVCHFLNLVLENVGTGTGSTVRIDRMRKPKTSLKRMIGLIEEMNAQKVGIAFIHGTNPAFSLPADFGFNYALRVVPLVVSFSSQLDETARLAHYILPANVGLESWGDSRPYTGVSSIVQPAMTPVFDTKQIGDLLISVAEGAGASIIGSEIEGGESTEKITNYRSFLEVSWRAIHKTQRASGDFETFWRKSLEQGGFFAPANSDGGSERTRVQINREVFKTKFETPRFAESFPQENSASAPKGEELHFMTYPSVKSFDGKSANRPWLQELADPITQVVWSSWAELHPDTAKKAGVEQGDILTIRNYNGELNLPVHISPYVHPQMVAVPLGQGHSSFGRFAAVVGGGNSYALLPKGEHAVPFIGGKVVVFRGRGREELIKLQGSDSQHGRHLARTTEISASGDGSLQLKKAHEAHEHDHVPKQMYQQREHPVYEWGLTIDLAACTGCSACVVACYAENNIPVVGKKRASEGREMSWLRIERYFDNAKADNGSEVVPAEELSVSFLPMMCQQCHNAPCEPVCPVYATYHNEEGLNAMIYNRCVGTRYCSNNCTYKVRRFNWYQYDVPEPLTWQLNPDVSRRTVGVMEKCTFCVQRIVEAKDHAKDEGRLVQDGEITPACVQSCPTQALSFGNLNDKDSKVSEVRKSPRAYKVLDYYTNTQPAVTYLERVRYAKS